MGNAFRQDKTEVDKPKKNSSRFFSQNTAGKIQNTIGRGEDAKLSLVYLTLRWSFISGVAISGFVVLNYWLFSCNEKVPDFMGDIRITWEIVVPVITLALGYAFGKSQK